MIVIMTLTIIVVMSIMGRLLRHNIVGDIIIEKTTKIQDTTTITTETSTIVTSTTVIETGTTRRKTSLSNIIIGATVRLASPALTN